MNLDRDVDMWTTGTRHPFVARYRAAADRASGRILSVRFVIHFSVITEYFTNLMIIYS